MLTGVRIARQPLRTKADRRQLNFARAAALVITSSQPSLDRRRQRYFAGAISEPTETIEQL